MKDVMYFDREKLNARRKEIGYEPFMVDWADTVKDGEEVFFDGETHICPQEGRTKSGFIINRNWCRSTRKAKKMEKQLNDNLIELILTLMMNLPLPTPEETEILKFSPDKTRANAEAVGAKSIEWADNFEDGEEIVFGVNDAYAVSKGLIISRRDCY